MVKIIFYYYQSRYNIPLEFSFKDLAKSDNTVSFTIIPPSIRRVTLYKLFEPIGQSGIRVRRNAHMWILVQDGADHQSMHLCTGFMGLPSGHFQAWANSALFDSVPITRKWFGACTPSTSFDLRAPLVWLPHHTCGKAEKLSGVSVRNM